MELHTIESRIDKSSSRCGKSPDDFFNIRGGELARNIAIPRTPKCTRCHRLESPVVLRVGLAATVDDLPHQLTSTSVNSLRQLHQAGDGIVRVNADLTHSLLSDGLDVEVAGDDQADPAHREVFVNAEELWGNSAGIIRQAFPSR
jgi:hypothetical protein